ncbi:Ku protein [Streptomyces lydicus]|uniref:Ku protein n=1 Tax=Streptomyces lydicus TaxID=47763 RepID=UPI0036ED2EB8
MHAVDGARIRQRRIYEAEGVEVPYEEVARATRLRMSRTVVLNDSDLADLPLPGVKTIEVPGFLPSDQIDPIARDRSLLAGRRGSRRPPVPFVAGRDEAERPGRSCPHGAARSGAPRGPPGAATGSERLRGRGDGRPV